MLVDDGRDRAYRAQLRQWLENQQRPALVLSKGRFYPCPIPDLGGGLPQVAGGKDVPAIAPSNQPDRPQLADPWQDAPALPSGENAPAHPLDRLLELEAEPSPVMVEELPEHLAKLCELSQQCGWVTARICKQKSRTFKDIPCDEIRSYFEQLLTRGVGACRGQGATMEWCLQPSV